jgi:uncharacterized protein (TIGR02145 family)
MIDSRDGKTYRTVVIGSQTWMAENLNYGTYLENYNVQFQNGAQKFCYDNDEANCATDGGLYQWHTAMNFDKECGDGSENCRSQIGTPTHKDICPSGWQVPKQRHWDSLAVYLGGELVAGKTMKMNNTGYSNWDDPKGNDGNSSGFSAIPTGLRSSGIFIRRGELAFFWTAIERNRNQAGGYQLSSFVVGAEKLIPGGGEKWAGQSIRCVKD